MGVDIHIPFRAEQHFVLMKQDKNCVCILLHEERKQGLRLFKQIQKF